MVVKICANKTIKHVKMCCVAGADIIGLLVGQEHESVDFIDKFTAKKLVDYVNGKTNTALVTHLTRADEIISLSKFIGNNIIQLHSNINEKEVEKIATALPEVKLIRLIHISKEGKICSPYKTFKFADYYLLDSFNLKTNQVGGTGLTHNWELDASLIKELNKPTFLAGGLTPDNVVEAINAAHPAGVDVNSGCKLNGKKNARLVKLFVSRAKNA